MTGQMLFQKFISFILFWPNIYVISSVDSQFSIKIFLSFLLPVHCNLFHSDGFLSDYVFHGIDGT